MPAAGTATSIKDIKLYVKTPEGNAAEFNPAVWENAALKNITLNNEAGTVVRTYTLSQQNDWDGKGYYFGAFGDSEITTGGIYTLNVPANLFSSSDGELIDGNNAFTVKWTINGGGGTVDPNDTDLGNTEFNYAYESVYPAPGNVVYPNDLGAFNFTWTSGIAVNPAFTPYMEMPDGSTLDANFVTDLSHLSINNTSLIRFDGAENWLSGTYTLVVPAGTFGTPEWAAANHKEGSANPELRLTYNYTANPKLEEEDPDDGSELQMTKAIIKHGGSTILDMLGEHKDIANIPGGSTFLFNSNKNETSMDIYVDVINKGTGESLWTAGTFRQQVTSETDIITLNGKNSDGDFELSVNPLYTMVFEKGQTYQIQAGFYKQFDGVPAAERVCRGTFIYEFEGTTPAYHYGTAEILSITPNPDEGCEFDDANNGIFTVKFSEPVEMENKFCFYFGDTGKGNYESFNSNADKTEWTFKLPASALSTCASQVDCKFAPRQDGHSLYVEDGTGKVKAVYTQGEKDNAYQAVAFPCYLGGGKLTVTPASGATVESLESFNFKCGSNIGLQAISAVGKILHAYVTDANGNQVSELSIKNDDRVENVNGENVSSIDVKLTTPVKKPGTYTLKVPGAFFMTGKESAAKSSAPITLNYTVENENYVPEPGEFVTVTLNLSEYASASYRMDASQPSVIDLSGSDYFELESLMLNGKDVTADVTAEGLYTIPATALADDCTLDAAFAFAPEVEFNFTNGVQTIEGCPFTVSSKGTILSITGLTEGANVNVYTTAGIKIASRVAEGNTMQLNIADGIYIITINDKVLKVSHSF